MSENNQIENIITAYLSGEATDEDCRKLEDWVKESSENERFFQEIRNVWQLANPPFDPETIDIGTAERKLYRLISKPDKRKALLLYWQRIAAILVIPLLLLSAFLLFDKGYFQSGKVEYQKVSVPFGTLSEVMLPDGSRVWLNGGSSLKYPLAFRKGAREVFLQGEGYFEVQSDQKNPFKVQLEQLTLTATGTAFNVDAYANDSLTSITMVQGEVAISMPGSAAMKIEPGERISFNNHTMQYSRINTVPYKWCAWKDGLMVFRDDPLSYVFKRLSLTFNVEIELDDPEIASAPYRATFEGESLDEILQLLEVTAPIRFVYSERGKNSKDLYDKQHITVYTQEKRVRTRPDHRFRRR